MGVRGTEQRSVQLVLSNADHPNHESVDVGRVLDVAEDTQF